MTNGIGKVGTMGIAILAVLMVGASLFMVNDYGAHQISAADETAANGYEIVGLDEITGLEESDMSSFSIYDGTLVYLHDLLGDRTIKVWNISDEEGFDVATSESPNATVSVDQGKYGVAWIEQFDDGGTAMEWAKFYIWANETLCTSEPWESMLDLNTIVVTGRWAVWANNSTITSMDMRTFAFEDDINITLEDNQQLKVVEGGEDGQVIYQILTTGVPGAEYHYLNIRTGADETVSTQGYSVWSQCDVWDEDIALYNYDDNFTLDTTDVDNAVLIEEHDSSHPSSAGITLYDGFISYAYSDTTEFTVKLYSIENGASVQIGVADMGYALIWMESYENTTIIASPEKVYIFAFEEVATSGTPAAEHRSLVGWWQDLIIKYWYLFFGAAIGLTFMYMVLRKRLAGIEYEEEGRRHSVRVDLALVLLLALWAAILMITLIPWG